MKEAFEKYNIKINDEKINNFNIYLNYLISENKKYNLTAITDEKEILYKHFIDSVLGAENYFQNAKIIDIGSGAGFPGIPLKIIRNDLEIYMVDSLNKRVNFLNNTINLLKLKNIFAVHARAEEFIKNNREQFDYAIARAVAPLPTLLEYLLPYVKVGGKCIIYKSLKLDDEIALSKNALDVLGGKIVDIQDYYIEEIDSTRKILIVEKIKNTNSIYPRGKNLPKQKPL